MMKPHIKSVQQCYKSRIMHIVPLMWRVLYRFSMCTLCRRCHHHTIYCIQYANRFYVQKIGPLFCVPGCDTASPRRLGLYHILGHKTHLLAYSIYIYIYIYIQHNLQVQKIHNITCHVLTDLYDLYHPLFVPHHTDSPLCCELVSQTHYLVIWRCMDLRWTE